MRIRLLLPQSLLLLVLIFACGDPASPPRSTPDRDKDLTGGGNFLNLPPVDLACAEDADCVLGTSVRRIEGACCYDCPSFPSNRSWKRLSIERCDAHNGSREPLPCPKLNCRPGLAVACRDHRCVITN